MKLWIEGKKKKLEEGKVGWALLWLLGVTNQERWAVSREFQRLSPLARPLRRPKKRRQQMRGNLRSLQNMHPALLKTPRAPMLKRSGVRMPVPSAQSE